MRKRPSRRTFIKLSAAAASVGAVEFAHAAPATPQVFIMTKESGITGSEPVQWAIGKLQYALTARGILVGNANSSVSYGSGTNIIEVILPQHARGQTVALSTQAGPHYLHL